MHGWSGGRERVRSREDSYGGARRMESERGNPQRGDGRGRLRRNQSLHHQWHSDEQARVSQWGDLGHVTIPFAQARPPAAPPAAPARGSAKREDKESLSSLAALPRRGGSGGRGAPSPPARRSSIRRRNAEPEGRGWSRAADRGVPKSSRMPPEWTSAALMPSRVRFSAGQRAKRRGVGARELRGAVAGNHAQSAGGASTKCTPGRPRKCSSWVHTSAPCACAVA